MTSNYYNPTIDSLEALTARGESTTARAYFHRRMPGYGINYFRLPVLQRISSLAGRNALMISLASDKKSFCRIMEYAYRFGDPRRLYLNVTNRCTNDCSFCIRCKADGLGGAVLWGKEEPDFRMLKDAVMRHGGLEDFREFVWCGYGEPTFRLELIKEAAAWLRTHGAFIRLNTNGHACLIHGRDVLGELSGAVDMVSVSLNAPNRERYLELCRPDLSHFQAVAGRTVTPEQLWDVMLDFLSRAPAFFPTVQASVVGSALAVEEIEQSRRLAHSLGVELFRVR
jgi:TatD family-associated radical SAM protein